tara:strand:- start:22770 stop:23117 length:348 start_codon:yes stop_codon:yes gene_type:complete
MFFKKIHSAFLNSFQGILNALKEEFAFKVEFSFSIFLIPAAFFIGSNSLEIILLITSTLLILLIELLNTSLETTLNRIGLEKNNLTKYAKDLGSGAVLISLLIWLTTWGLIVFSS